MKKNRLFAAFTAAALALSLDSCGSAPASTPASASGGADGESFKVGIVQYTSHSSLDEICTAIQSELTALSEESRAAGGPAELHGQHRTDPLSAGKQAVPHGLLQAAAGK